MFRALLVLAVALPACVPEDPAVGVDAEVNQRVVDGGSAGRVGEPGDDCARTVATGAAPYNCRATVTTEYCGCWQRSNGVATFSSDITEADCDAAPGVSIPLYWSDNPFPASMDAVEADA